MTLRFALARTASRLPRNIVAYRPVTSVMWTRGYTEGATGGIRPGGEHAGDTFTRREKAQEDYYIKQREKERLARLREKLAASRKHLDDLEQDM
ncbi:hypothetical protein ABW19_dt0203484 [Dactylella cylindrospora]|nr:hypothetical protein ABW19_dt0203484 [Dactylella cylindrospora]